MSKIGARDGAFGVANEEVDNAIITADFLAYDCDLKKINPIFLFLMTTSNQFIEFCISNSSGTALKRLDETKFLNAKIPLPPMEIQNEIVAKIEEIKNQIKSLQEEEKRLKEEIEAYIYIALGLKAPELQEKQKVFVVRFKNLERWDISFNQKNATPFACRPERSEVSLNCHCEGAKRPKQSIMKEVDCHEFNKLNSRNDKTPNYPLIALNEICYINPNVDFKEAITQNKKVSFIPMEAVLNNGVDFYPKDRMASDYKGFTKFQNNDLLWAKITPCMQNKKSVVVKNLKNGLGFGSTEFFVIRPKNKDEVDINFILHFLRMDSVIENAKLHFKGSAGQQRVPKEFLQSLKIPLPSLEVQQEIVNFIERKQVKIKQNQSIRIVLEKSLEKTLENLLLA